MHLWRWFDVFVVAENRGAAWGLLVDRFGENGAMAEALSERWTAQDFVPLAPEEYLGAVPPNEQVEIPNWALPSVADPLVPDSEDPTGYITTMGCAEARHWAVLLPAHAIVNVTG